MLLTACMPKDCFLQTRLNKVYSPSNFFFSYYLCEIKPRIVHALAKAQILLVASNTSSTETIYKFAAHDVRAFWSRVREGDNLAYLDTCQSEPQSSKRANGSLSLERLHE